MMREGIEFRPPVIDAKTVVEFDYRIIERQWRLITETIKREIAFDQSVRAVLLEFVASPLSETLSQEIISKISTVNNRVGALVSKYSDSLIKFLELPAVPDDQIVPDVQNAPTLGTIDGVTESLAQAYGADTPKFTERLAEHIEYGTFTKGITREEGALVGKRYRFARDLKTLCLAAELVDHPVDSKSNGREMVLPSGVKIMIDSPYTKYGVELLNPTTWESRRQLKDRVYEVVAGGHRYILKERKTPRHLHQKKDGYVPPLTSIEEFSVAKDLNKNGRVGYDRVDVEWEKPIGYAEFPDGFQFTIFEYSDIAKTRHPGDEYYGDGKQVVGILKDAIVNNRDQFEEEYQKVAELAEGKFIDDPEIIRRVRKSSEPILSSALRLIRGQKTRPTKLDFDDFAIVKAIRMIEQSRRLMQAVEYGLGYSNNDHDGFACRVSTKDRVRLKIIGFDFEYFTIGQDKPDTQTQRRHTAEYLLGEIERSRDNFPDVRYYFSDPHGETRQELNRAQAAAHLAMLNLEKERLVEGLSNQQSV